jgi:hypothetical protein
VNTNQTAKRLRRLAIASVCLAIVAATADAAQPPDDGYALPEPGVSPPLGRRYYGAIDPNPIGYYPYAYYQGSGFPVGRAVGYYPYPNAHPYVVPTPYPYGYYGFFGGYGGLPFYGYPGGGWGGGWGAVAPYGMY